MALSGARGLLPKHKADYTDAPVLVLMDRLLEAGYSATERTTHHELEGELVFDARHAPGKHAYFHCLLDKQRLFAAGCPPFSSKQPLAWYRLALRKPGAHLAGLTGKAAMQALKAAAEEPGLLPLPAPPALALRDAEAPPAGGLEVDVDGGSTDEEMPALEDAPEGGLPPALEDNVEEVEAASTSSSSSDSSSSSGDDSEAQPPAPASLPLLNGRQVKEKVVGNPPRFGWIVTCDNEVHRATCGCEKFRSTHLDEGQYGGRGTEFYLRTWMARSASMAGPAHSSWRPKKAEVAAWVAENVGPDGSLLS